MDYWQNSLGAFISVGTIDPKRVDRQSRAWQVRAIENEYRVHLT